MGAYGLLRRSNFGRKRPSGIGGNCEEVPILHALSTLVGALNWSESSVLILWALNMEISPVQGKWPARPGGYNYYPRLGKQGSWFSVFYFLTWGRAFALPGNFP